MLLDKGQQRLGTNRFPVIRNECFEVCVGLYYFGVGLFKDLIEVVLLMLSESPLNS
jgi:hypothetical protein